MGSTLLYFKIRTADRSETAAGRLTIFACSHKKQKQQINEKELSAAASQASENTPVNSPLCQLSAGFTAHPKDP
ncbi:hypothetical protein DDV21_004575 [Streptococcus chenjunshii]|uniref:Uncharacterized protein n=1 Tax=Streptococcus chenjunshii TaxID=2173853 RepID=A0A372KMI5_9STRE|nr:hypothetical protein DDV21_004575 [Streptococcus chenjunshii]RFU50528.1 hypothetical protein DDV22_08270 [Streptococcus chenjunshii]RFU52788.1 hypothetical protein DDV23_07910 [Streptococcus chenjunshii]